MTTNEPGFLKGYDIAALREKITREPFKAIFDAIVRQVHDAAEKDRQSDVILPGGWCHSQYFTPRVLEAGFVYAMTGDAIAAAHVARQIDKVARVYSNPPESFHAAIEGFTGKASAYFTNAHTCMAARMCREGLSDDSWSKLLDVARRQLIDDCGRPDYFFTHYNAGHNAVATHAIAAAMCALTLGHEAGHPKTDQIIEWGRDACEMHAHWGFDDQGVPHEGPMYSLVTLEWVFHYAQMLRDHGGENLFQTIPKFQQIAQACCEMIQPGMVGYIGFDDTRQLIEKLPMPWLLLTSKEYDRPQDLALWTDTITHNFDFHRNFKPTWHGVRELLWWNGETAERPLRELGLPLAHFGMGKAVGTMRTSWSDDAVCVTVLGQGRSHNVPDHTHGDASHFSIFAHGDYLAYDTAYFNFDEDTHSVILIDDKPFHHATQGNLYAGRFADAQHTAMVDCVHVEMAAAKGCMWAERIVLFVRCSGDEGYMVVCDNVNVDNQKHNYKWQLQANMHTNIDVTGNRTATVHGKTARLDCHFFIAKEGDNPGHPHTLKVWADDHEHLNVMTKEPQTNPRLVAELEGPNGTMMSLVVPRRKDAPALTVRDESGYRTWSIKVEHGDYIDQIIYAADHVFIRQPDLKASSPVIVVRRDRAGTVLDTWTIDGKPVQPR